MVNGILQSAISGLNASAQSVASAADNVVNVSTPGYKRSDVSTATLATQQSTSAYSAGGVQGVARQLADVQGVLASSTRSTDLAISGNGYFAVSSQAQGGETLYTRDGSFAPDAQGNLVNSGGYFLQARQPGGSGGLTTVNVGAINGTAQATSNISVGANLPANASVGDTHTVSVNVTDSLGTPHAVQLQFTAQANGDYQLTIPGAQQGDGSGAAYNVGVSTGSDGLISGFDSNGDGTIDSSSPPGVYIAYSSSGAASLSIGLDLSGVTGFSGDFAVHSIQSDGASYGSASDISVSSGGVLSATFDNGQTRDIANIAVATFASPENLHAVSGNAYRATDASGGATYNAANAGSVQNYALERSTTDLGTEFAGLIVAQSVYSASLKVLSAGDELSRSLLSIRA